MDKKTTKEILKRMVALAVVQVTAILAGGAILGVDPLISGLTAAIVAIIQVSNDLAKAFLDDGKISMNEVNEVFNKKVDKDKK